eukprot:9433097-Pyramimonas_sp.AAC.1
MAASGGVKRRAVGGQSPGAASSSGNLTDNDFFMKLVRYALYTGQDVNDLKNATSLVILVKDTGIKKKPVSYTHLRAHETGAYL